MATDKGVDITLFSEELLNLLSKHGYKGVSGVFINHKNDPLVLQTRQPGEQGKVYDFIAHWMILLLTSFNQGKGPVFSGEATIFVHKESDNEMPF